MISNATQLKDFFYPQTDYFSFPRMPSNDSAAIDKIFENYREIDFRDISTALSIKKATNNIHSYPAKMFQQIPYVFFSCFFDFNENNIVLDPFCGTGTVLLAAKMSNIKSYGIDINPLSRLIAKVKTTPIKANILREGTVKLFENILSLDENIKPPNFPNIDFWFSTEVQRDLAVIKYCIDNFRFDNKKQKLNLQNFFYVCFSSIIRKVSYADPDIVPPVKSKIMLEKIAKGLKLNTFQLFVKEIFEKSKQVKELDSLVSKNIPAKIIGKDIRYMRLENAVDAVITSPPYICAQKYFRSTRLELFWLGLVNYEEFTQLDIKQIGTERIFHEDYKYLHLTGLTQADKLLEKIFEKYPQRAYIAYKYFSEMKKAIEKIYKALKLGGYFILLIGNNNVTGEEMPSHKILTEIAMKAGFWLEFLPLKNKIHSRGFMTKRNKTAGVIDSEWVLIFKKYERD